MNIITKGRGQGKTYDLIITSEVTGYPIVTATETMAGYIVNQARQMGRKIPEPMSLNKFKKYRENYTYTGRDILVDELDLVVNTLLGVNVIGATHSQPEKL